MVFRGERIYLRKVDLCDVDTLLQWENDSSLERYGLSHTDYTRQQIEDFISEQRTSIDQLRLMIVLAENSECIGAIDLFDIHNHRAEIGILIYDKALRHKGYASEAIEVVVKNVAATLGIEHLSACVALDNRASIALFQRCGFIKKAITVTRLGVPVMLFELSIVD